VPPTLGIAEQKLGVADVEFVAAYDVDSGKVGAELRDAALGAPNTYPILDVETPLRA
jgi:myo-inositol-1-phosphate synthase